MINKKINVFDLNTFDSGLGGMFTAVAIQEFIEQSITSPEQNIIKDLAKQGIFFKVSHFGDTINAPYGDRSQDEISNLTSKGVIHSLNQAAELVFIACNTASTQYKSVINAVKEKFGNESKEASKVVSIIDKSAEELVSKVINNSDAEQSLGMFGTKATVNSSAYVNAFIEKLQDMLPDGHYIEFSDKGIIHNNSEGYSYNSTEIEIKSNDTNQLVKKVNFHQYAPHNWVPLIEGGADIKEKQTQVDKDVEKYIELFGDSINSSPEPIGMFCTHYPALENNIKLSFSNRGISTSLIAQGALMKQVFEEYLFNTYQNIDTKNNQIYDDNQIIEIYKNGHPPLNQIKYHITGINKQETEASIRTLFGSEKNIVVENFTYGRHTERLGLETNNQSQDIPKTRFG